MANEIDTDQQLTDDQGKATSYFEDEWFQIVSQINALREQLDALQARVDIEHPP